MTDEDKPGRTTPRSKVGPMQQQPRREGPYYSLMHRQRYGGSYDAQVSIGSDSDEQAVQV